MSVSENAINAAWRLYASKGYNGVKADIDRLNRKMNKSVFSSYDIAKKEELIKIYYSRNVRVTRVDGDGQEIVRIDPDDERDCWFLTEEYCQNECFAGVSPAHPDAFNSYKNLVDDAMNGDSYAIVIFEEVKKWQKIRFVKADMTFIHGVWGAEKWSIIPADTRFFVRRVE